MQITKIVRSVWPDGPMVTRQTPGGYWEEFQLPSFSVTVRFDKREIAELEARKITVDTILRYVSSNIVKIDWRCSEYEGFMATLLYVPENMGRVATADEAAQLFLEACTSAYNFLIKN